MLPNKWLVCGLLVFWLVIAPLSLTCLNQQALAQQPCPDGEECEPNNRFGDANVTAAPGTTQGHINARRAGDAETTYQFHSGISVD